MTHFRYHSLKFIFTFILSLYVFLHSASAQTALVTAEVDLYQQQMQVYINDELWYRWPVSTGRRGFRTPRGNFSPKRLHRSWFSRKYYNSPMPYSVFFHGGYAIHGTNDIYKLGRPASHGCVRLHTQDAAELFRLITFYGSHNTQIVIY